MKVVSWGNSRYLLGAVFIGLLFLLFLTVYFTNEEQVFLSAEESTITQDEDGSWNYGVIIENIGLDPMEVYECSLENLDCEASCLELPTLLPGEKVQVDIECALGVTFEDINNAKFNVISKTVSQSNSRTTVLPSKPKPKGETGGQKGEGSGSGSGGGGGQIGSLAKPSRAKIEDQINIANFVISNTMPIITASPPLLPFGAESIECGWDNLDKKYTAMTKKCIVGVAITCALPLQREGDQTYTLSCAALNRDKKIIAENTESNNIDFKGKIVTIAQAPVIDYNKIIPRSGTVFHNSIVAFIIHFYVTGADKCMASVVSATVGNPSSQGSPTNVPCSLDGSNGQCNIPLAVGENIVSLKCTNEASNKVASVNDLIYFRDSAVSSGSEDPPSGGDPIAGSTSGGGGGGAIPGPSCGDGSCSGGETCSACAGDCGVCGESATHPSPSSRDGSSRAGILMRADCYRVMLINLVGWRLTMLSI